MTTSYPSLNFDLGADIDLQRAAIHAFAQAEIAHTVHITGYPLLPFLFGT